MANGLTYFGGAVYKTYRKQAVEVIYPLLRENCWRFSAREMIIAFSVKARFIQLRICKQLSYNKLRREKLRSYWNAELFEWKSELGSSDEGVDMDLLYQMSKGAFENEELIDKLLNSYLEKCIHQHSLAFF